MSTYWIFFHTSVYVGSIRRSVTGPKEIKILNLMIFHIHCERSK